MSEKRKVFLAGSFFFYQPELFKTLSKSSDWLKTQAIQIGHFFFGQVNRIFM